MKRRLLFILSLLLPTLLMANPVGKEQAQEKALSFLNGRSAAKARGPKAASNLRLVMSQDCYHVFNIGTGDGFVIVSGDDCAPDILGYADSGTIDPQSMPDNMKAWLQGYADQIEWMKAHGVKAEKSFTTRAAKSSISPLLKSTWNQGAPYYSNTPTKTNSSSETEHCVTGCVATAMAQIMYYHKWPEGPTGVIPGSSISGYPELSELASTTFNWSNMYNSYNNGEDGTEVAKLMLYCGTAVKMKYDLSENGGSGTSTSYVPKALINYFGYDTGAQYLSRELFSYSEWIEIIYNELASLRPVLFSGTSTGGGHAFICDGYAEEDMYHFNWGWGGKSNGNFRLSLLAPKEQGAGGSSTSDGYNFDQSIGIGIKPGTGANYEAMTINALSANSNSFTRTSTSNDFTGITLTSEIRNKRETKQAYDTAWGLYQGTTLIKILSNWTTAELEQNYGYSSINYNLTFGADLADGTYTLKALSKVKDTGEWHLDYGSDNIYATATINGLDLTLSVSAPPTPKTPNLAVNSVKVDGSAVSALTIGEEKDVVINITNSGEDFHGDITLALMTGETTINEKLGGICCDINVGQTKDITVKVAPTKFGTYALTVLQGTFTSGTILKQENVTIGEPSSSVNLAISDYQVNTAGSSIIYGNTFKVSFKAKNNGSETYQYGFTAELYQNTTGSGGPQVSKLTNNKTLAAGEEATIEFEFKGLEYGEEYFSYAEYYSYTGTTKYKNNIGTHYSYTMTHGFITIDANGNVTAAAPTASVTIPASAAVVDLRGQSTVTSVDATAANPNCIFLLDGDATTPSGITKNIVKGTNAESISLTDGYNFYSPIDFTANNIEFNYTFTVGADGSKGWNTLVLPFNVTKVTANGTEIDWFKSGSDSGKNFWVKEFVSDGASTVNFGYASAIEANKPYIVAFPGNHWGTNWDMSSKAIKFIGQNVNVSNSEVLASITCDNYRFVGSTRAVDTENIYCLDTDANKFKAKATGGSTAFRAFFVPCSYDSSVTSLAIGGDIDLTGIDSIINSEAQEDGIYYNLKGQRVANPTKGLYILNGKKVVIK